MYLKINPDDKDHMERFIRYLDLQKCSECEKRIGLRFEPGTPFYLNSRSGGGSEAEYRLFRALRDKVDCHTYDSIAVANSYRGLDQTRPDIILPELRVAIELDSYTYHKDKLEDDKLRDTLLSEVGWNVLRIREKGLPYISTASVIELPLLDDYEHVADYIIREATKIQRSEEISVEDQRHFPDCEHVSKGSYLHFH